MSSPDVRVRLTAEGVSEVVAALRKVRAESEASGASSARSFRGFGAALSSVRSLAVQLSAALAVGQITAFVQRSAQAADEMGKLGQRVGASVENISALAVGARTADVELESLQGSLGLLAQKLVQLRAGAPEAARAFGALGLRARDFDGKDTAEALELVASRMGGLEDSADKTAIAPLLNDLSQGGLGAMRDRARELGLLLDGQLVQSLQAMNDDMALLGAQAEGVGAQFAAAMAPDIRQAVKAISASLQGEGVQAFRDFARIVGFVIRLVTGLVLGLAELVRTQFTQIKLTVVSLVQAVPRALKGDFAGAKEIMDAAFRARIEDLKAARERLAKIVKDLTSAAEDPGPLRGGTQDSAADAARIFQQRAEVVRAGIRNELALFEAKIALEDEMLQQQYRDGLISARTYYREQLALIERASAVRVGALVRQRVAAEQLDDATKRQIELQQIDTELAKENVRLNGERARALATYRNELRTLGQQNIQFQQEIARAEGDRVSAERLGLQKELDDLRERQTREGVPEADIEANVAEFKKIAEAGFEFEQTVILARERLNDLLERRGRIQAQVEAGAKGEMEGEREILELERERYPQLLAISKALLKAAEATRNPEMIAAARDYVRTVEDIGLALEAADASFRDFQRAAGSAFRSSLTQTLAAVGREIRTLGEFFESFLDNVLDGLQQIAAQQLSSTIFKGLFSGVPGFADGGLVRGPGGPRSDGLLAFLSPGEFVVNAASVSEPGALALLEHINKMGGIKNALEPHIDLGSRYSVHRYADGGFVTAEPASVNGQIEVGLEPGLVAKHIATPEGQKAILKVIAQNRRGIGRILG